MCVRSQVRVRVPNSIRDQEVERHAQDKSGEKGKKKGLGGRGCGREYGFGFPSLRGESINSEADRVAARGCAGTQREHDLTHQQGRHLTPHRVREDSGELRRR